MSEEIRVWGIHTLDDNLFLKENVVAIGWNEIGDLSKIAPDRGAFKKTTYTNLIRKVMFSSVKSNG